MQLALAITTIFICASTAIAETPTAKPSPSPTPMASPSPTPAASPSPIPSPDPIAVETPAPIPEKTLADTLTIRPWVTFDIIGAFPTENAVPSQERFRFRTIDVGAKFEFDSYSHAVIDVGGRESNGSTSLKLREGYIATRYEFVSARAGSFFLNVGLLNRLASVKWPFPSAPLSHTEFFSEERIHDSGAEIELRATERLALGLGVTNGYWYGTAPTTGGDKPLTPTHYVRPSFFIPVGDGRADVAFDYLSRVDFSGERLRIGGMEVSFSRGSVDTPTWLTMFELNHRYRHPSGLAIEETLGGYLYNQARIDARWAAGLRLDAVTIPTLTTATGEHRKNLRSAIVPVVSYRVTDSTQLKAGYTYMRETRDGDSTRGEQRFELVFAANFDRFTPLKVTSSDRPSL